MKGIERKALIFATRAHESVHQLRKYTGDPYIVHPISVAQIVKTVPHTPQMVAAALLHDVVEDTPVELKHIYLEFGPEISELVGWLTDISTPEDGNRAARKAIDRAHIAAAPAAAQTIKLADLIDNTKTIRQHDPDFWRVYRQEKLSLLQVLNLGDTRLRDVASRQCAEI